MTIVLVGVGADTEHLRPALRLTDDGHFDYIPIPESYPTSEKVTYGNWELQHRGGVASEFIERIRPEGEDGEWTEDKSKIQTHPVHHDPNFGAMTFGDRRGQGGKGATLVNHLDSGSENDVLGFYTGVKECSDDQHLNRFLYGFMAVEEVHDLSSYDGEDYRDALLQFPENAHAKRLEEAGNPKHDDLVIVEGRSPSRILETPIKISERIDRPPWYQVSQWFSNTFNVTGGQKGIGRKFPLVLDFEQEAFIERVNQYSQ